MANKCLVSKLEGSVDNENKRRLGELLITRTTLGSYSEQKSSLTITNSKQFTIRTTGDGYMAESYADLEDTSKRFKEFTIDANTSKTLYYSNGDYYIFVSEKYTIKSIDAGGTSSYMTKKFDLNTSELLYTKTLTSIVLLTLTDNGGGLFGNIGDLGGNSSLVTLNLQGLTNNIGSTRVHNLIGSINDFYDMDSLKILSINNCINITGSVSALPSSLERINIRDTGISGTASDLGKFTSAIRIMVTGTKITGSIEDLVDSFITNGRTSASGIDCQGILAHLTFGGSNYGTVNNSEELYFESVQDDNPRIWIIRSTSSTTYVHAENCTQEQIADWRDAGYTVIEVTRPSN